LKLFLWSNAMELAEYDVESNTNKKTGSAPDFSGALP